MNAARKFFLFLKNSHYKIIIIIGPLVGLYFASLYNYLLFHSLTELFSIVIACSIFLLAWNSRHIMDNNFLLFIGISSLFIGGMDLVHTLAYKGMNIFPGYDANLPTQLWIATRYLQSISILIAILLIRRPFKTTIALMPFSAVTIFLLLSVFVWPIFPNCYIEGEGLTSFKIISEYIISLIMLLSIFLLYRNRREIDSSVYRYLIISFSIMIGAELAFTTYLGVYDLSNFTGHILKIFSFYFLYQAIVVTGLMRPYDLLFRNLKNTEENLIEARDNLEQRVKERTLELRENEKSLQRRTFDLGERVKELNCLYSISKLAEMPNLSRKEFLQRTVNLILPGWQYPDITCAKLELDGQIIRSSNFKESKWEQASDIVVKGKRSGFLKVYYLEERPDNYEGPFLKEERDLIEAITEILGNTIERKQSDEDIRDYTQRIETLIEIDKTISSTVDLDQVLKTIISEIKAIIPYDSLSVQLLKDSSLEVMACGGFDNPDDIVGLVFPLESKFPNHQVIDTKNSLAIADVTLDYPHFDIESEKYGSAVIRSWLGLPLISKGTIIGMIALDRYKVNPFTEIEINMAAAITSQAALAIENARLYSEATARLDQLSSLREIDKAISGSLDLRLILKILLGHVIQQLDIDAAAVLLINPESQILEFMAGQGFRTEVLQHTNLRMGEGFAGKAALERRIIKVSDLNNLNTGFLRSPKFKIEEFIAYIGIPLISKGTITGVLEIYQRKPLDHDPEWFAFLETLAGQAAIAIENISLIKHLRLSNQDLLLAYDATIEGWAQALELRDMETVGHSRRVVDLTLELARALDIKHEEIQHIIRGALLHDIGKMGIPDAILQKNGKLTDDEWVIMQEHPVLAYEWLSQITFLKRALDIPYCHHEKWDGSGYPRGLKGEQIPLSARIFSIVDVWDALNSDRPYRKAWSKNKVIKHIRDQSGNHFDPAVVDKFLTLVG